MPLRAGLTLTSALVLATQLTSPASAHPHVWVTYEVTVVYDKANVTGVEHVWTFDDAYTTMAIEGLDKNGDGKYDREELAELAKVNMEGLKDFSYFTFAKLGDKDLAFAPPQDAWLEYSDNKMLRLHFRLPLAQPAHADATGLNISIYDPSFFIAFEPEATDAVRVAKAPSGCTAKLVEPEADKAAQDAARLGEAFAQQLGGASPTPAARSVVVACAKS